MRRGDQVVLAALCGLLVLLSACHWARLSGWGMREVEIERNPSRQYDFRIDINAATWVEWFQLPGVGEMLARRIIEDREQSGPFETVEDLGRVKGIGPKTIENLRPYLRVNASAHRDQRPD
jgi:competence protein ComEA